MKMIIEWVKEFFDLTSVLIFLMINAYLLFIDVPSLERQKIQREAKIVKYLGWGGLVFYLGLIGMNIFW